ACMLWHEVQGRWQRLREAGEPAVPALQQAIDLVFDARIGDISGRGKLAADMREIWMMQPRFERRSGNGPYSLVEQPRYRAGFDFLLLRAEVGDLDMALVDWWEDFALGSDEERRALVEQARESERQQRKGGGGGRVRQVARGALSGDTRAAASGAESSEEEDADADEGPDEGREAAPARKRRRRRKPRSGGGGGAPAGSGADAG
ncbi:MAG TPA: polynucleotide adenylyltransferase PcnB, partial [Burkholderiaceae bacterium]|nr:polynucleotide adenylyltransferase PcnB [Burkholderiaceae bacterium]